MAIRRAVGVGGRRVTRSDRCSGSLVRRPVWPVVDVAGCGWSEGVEEAEERPQPWVVGEDAAPHAPAGGDDLGGISMKAARKVRRSMVGRRRRCSLWRSAQRGLTGSNRAHQAFRLQASAAMVMWAQLAHGVLTGACRADSRGRRNATGWLS
jgi:hypothetical protein